MGDVRVTYDRTAHAAYAYLSDPQSEAGVAHMYPCDPAEAGGVTVPLREQTLASQAWVADRGSLLPRG
ncbi:hypothetical protein ACFVDQ_37615 [Streptomyces sp. NPDC057684]|uniref:hypothetical protein n=1 Tax=unclassified Streptomyces TaxID=2593676 RepID=UPI0036CA07B3